MTNYRPTSSLPPVVKNLLIINVLLLVLTMIGDSQGIDLTRYLGLHYFKADSFMPHQIISYMFMHANFYHLFSNMFGLYIFGKILEQFWGSKRFLIYYMVTGIGAGLIQEIVWHFQLSHTAGELLNFYVTVGASGAIFGILLAFGMLFPNTELMLLFFPVPIKAKYFVIMYAIFELYSGVAQNSGDNVAHFAHLGGMLFGFVLLKYWQKKRNNFY